jgi:SNF2 family DNA or RNA helicase
MKHAPGTLVRYRKREWIVISARDSEHLLLRPLGGGRESAVLVNLKLASVLEKTLPFEAIEPGHFSVPTIEQMGDEESVGLLLDSARLLIRDGTAPFQSFSRISIRPRQYQLVPLMMALRLQTVRLLVADDVGTGKTIEAGLIVRELLDRGAANRLAVICPPYLCDQWQSELLRKFQIEAEVVKSGTLASLERRLPPDRSLFEYYPYLILSVDLIKAERYAAPFLQHCPDLVLVDEVHGMAAPGGSGGKRGVQQRHDLLRSVAAKEDRHMVLLSATPHSGIEESFLSVLGLLRPEFQNLNIAELTEKQRATLAQHFVQRRRADLKRWLDEDTPFPERDEADLEQGYKFHREYKAFFEQVYEFARELVKDAENLSGARKRMKFYSALALMRSISSSPEAAAVSLRARLSKVGDEEDTGESATVADTEENFRPFVLDAEDQASDTPPSAVLEETQWKDSEREKLEGFARKADSLCGEKDSKLQNLLELVKTGLKKEPAEYPIVWCRYISTARYVAEHLRSELRRVQVLEITGEIPDAERKLKIEGLSLEEPRVLVATDCLSEGVNLQDAFNAVIHYDLPWNPNRMEQREGRVDRFGQRAKQVRIYMLFGRDNPVDGAILQVLLRKARSIHKQLGIQLPIPLDSESILETVMQSIFLRKPGEDPGQLPLFAKDDPAYRAIQELDEYVKRAEEKEKESRSRFAQKKFETEEIDAELRRELEETDRVLGNPAQTEDFFIRACKKLQIQAKEKKKSRTHELRTNTIPPLIREKIGKRPEWWHVSFQSPEPEGSEYIGRNHPLIEALAETLMESALAGGSRCCGTHWSSSHGCRGTENRPALAPRAIHDSRQK